MAARATCPACRKVLPTSAFWTNAYLPNGRDRTCKACRAARRRELRRGAPRLRTRARKPTNSSNITVASAGMVRDRDGQLIPRKIAELLDAIALSGAEAAAR